MLSFAIGSKPNNLFGERLLEEGLLSPFPQMALLLGYFDTVSATNRRSIQSGDTLTSALQTQKKTATDLRNQVNEGKDVSLEKKLSKQKQRNLETLNDVADVYMSRQTHLKHPKVPRLRYDKHIRPTIGKLPVDRVTVKEIDIQLQTTSVRLNVEQI